MSSAIMKDDVRRKTLTLGVFFSHPTQHHSVMFQHLSSSPDVQTKVFYFDPGLAGGMYDPGYGTKNRWDIDLLSGTDSRVLFNPFRSKSVVTVRQFNPGIIPIILRERFDAIYVLGYAAPSSWLALLCAKLTRAHVFYTSDTNVLDEQRNTKRTALGNFLRRLFLRQVDTFLVIGNKNREAYLAMGMDPKKFIWCPIPVDRTRYRAALSDPALSDRLGELRQRYDIPKDAKVVVFCGKLIPRKRPGDIVAALRILGRSDVYALLIGSGELEPELRASLTPSDNIRITGFVNQSQIPYHMALGDVGVVSSDVDPHPLVTTEFASCGLPVIVSDQTGVWGEDDILRPGENGEVYRCADPNDLAAKLRPLLDDQALCRRMGKRSLELSELQSAEHAAAVLLNKLRNLSGQVNRHQ